MIDDEEEAVARAAGILEQISINREASYLGHLQTPNSEISFGNSSADTQVEVETQFRLLQKKLANHLECRHERRSSSSRSSST